MQTEKTKRSYHFDLCARRPMAPGDITPPWSRSRRRISDRATRLTKMDLEGGDL